MEMMLQTQNLCKYFRKQKAVNNVSLNIEKGQIYGLLGPNGAGKSTTLKMLTGMMKPTAGKIYFDGKLLDRKDSVSYTHLDVYKRQIFRWCKDVQYGNDKISRSG